MLKQAVNIKADLPPDLKGAGVDDVCGRRTQRPISLLNDDNRHTHLVEQQRSS
ncbi:unannotated protein [freshwater metagenome]|uniref:Unannotated protein n=1 Tax=freshwater metagenome TaxID=449393 RepID=A0A6J6ZFY8_9ZZZZ